MAAADHELFATTDNPPLAALTAYPAILPGLNTYTGQIIKSLFDRHKLKLQVSLATNYLETIRMMASVGLGWTVLPRSMRDESITTIAVKDVSIERTLGIVYHQGRSLSRAAKAFIDAVMDCADTQSRKKT